MHVTATPADVRKVDEVPTRAEAAEGADISTIPWEEITPEPELTPEPKLTSEPEPTPKPEPMPEPELDDSAGGPPVHLIPLPPAENNETLLRATISRSTMLELPDAKGMLHL